MLIFACRPLSNDFLHSFSSSLFFFSRRVALFAAFFFFFHFFILFLATDASIQYNNNCYHLWHGLYVWAGEWRVGVRCTLYVCVCVRVFVCVTD